MSAIECRSRPPANVSVLQVVSCRGDELVSDVRAVAADVRRVNAD